MAFGFSQIVFNAVMQSLTGTSNNMQADAKNYQKEAESLLKQAEAFAAQARQFLSTIPNFKWVTVDTTDSEGNPTTTQEQQPDKEADAAAQASAADCEQKAADCNQNATQLQALVAALLAQIANLAKQILGFSNAGEETQKAITNSTNLLVAGASMIGKVISVFNVPEAKNVGDWAKGFGNNVLKTFVGVDLSDGIDTDEVNKIAGIVVDTGATVVSGFTSIVVSSLVASTPIGGTVLASLAVGAVRGGTNLLLNLGRDTAAKAVSKNIVSGLNFIGIKVKEPEKKEDETKVDTDGVNKALEGKQDEMGTLEDATKKNAEEGGNVVGTIASEEVITGDLGGKVKKTDRRVLQSDIDNLVEQQTTLKNSIASQEERKDRANKEYEININELNIYNELSKKSDIELEREGCKVTRGDAKNRATLYRQRSINDMRNKKDAIDNIRNLQAKLDTVNEKLEELNADAEKYGTK